jgi:hypothetical protein
MTAEIGVLNKHAVALAADSAVTIRTQNGRKIYNSVNKLFSLSKYHPVGIMIYGGADLCGVPWETIIKTYRKKLNTAAFPSIKEYAIDFINYINKKNSFFPQKEQEAYTLHLVQFTFLRVSKQIQSAVHELLEGSKDVPFESIDKVVAEVIIREYSKYSDMDDIKTFSPPFKKRFHTHYKAKFTLLIDNLFEKYPLSVLSKKRLLELGYNVILKNSFSSYSGVVIAGFGDDEIFPALVSFKANSVVCNELRYALEDDVSIGHSGSSAAVIPFAQSDMVHAFMCGIDPALTHVMEGFLSALFKSYPTRVIEHIQSHLTSDQLKKIGDLSFLSTDVLSDFKNNLGGYQKENLINPIVQSVAFLPKEELAVMAETLINLTLFKQKISVNSDETVGGAIDVAIISKGDGFIWMKRKHYFNPEINSRFFKNYHHENNEE